MSVNWIHFPQSSRPSSVSIGIVDVFVKTHAEINSEAHDLSSNEVLAVLAPGLTLLGFRVESGKKKSEKIPVPVFYGLNGQIEKSFDADAHHEAMGYVVEVEAGRGVVNNQFLKDLFQACMMDGVSELCIAVRNDYKGQQDFLTVTKFMQTLFVSKRLSLPLRGLLVIGY